ncbi:right-handed parallel beta-helix repeat-containing protein [Formosa sp. L2A11]|uniref:right-handed parallel beta-helix repeat-containing protein n=1 Tax=Formosa sp. L2A11 TaxID=2686363 RepID=UPI00131E9BE0|nr:right-handed parallel beta-helix repeat-containing protein [Formosa sp. L2A11]
MKNYYAFKQLLFLVCLTFLSTTLWATDQTVAPGESIQTAIDNVAASGGGIVTLAKGTHVITTPVRMKSNITLQGEGNWESLLQTTVNMNMIIADDEGLVNLTIQNLAIQGTNAINGGGIQITSQGVDHENITIINVHCFETGWGVHIKGAKNLLVQDCLFERNGTAGKEGYAHNMYLRRVYGAEVRDSQFLNSTSANGINISYSEDIKVYNCEMSGNYFRGIRAANTDGYLVYDCIVKDNGDVGILANSEGVPTTNIDIKRNCVSNNVKAGISGVNGVTGIVYDNNSHGNETDYSLPSSVTQSGNISDDTINCVYDDAPSVGLSAVPGDDMIYLNWGLKNITPTRQDVFRDTDSDPSGRTLIQSKVTGLDFTDTTAENGVTYWYWIKVTDDVSNTYNSNAATTTAVNVDPVITLSATKGNSEVVLNWEMNGITLGDQDVFRDTDSDPDGRVSIANNVEGNTYTDDTAENGTEYFYWIKATDVSGESTDSNVANATPAVPDPSVTLQAYSGDNSVLLQWELKDITLGDQDIFRDTDSDPSGRVSIANNVEGDSYTDTTAETGVEYWYWVKATDVSGVSTNSEPVSAIAKALNPLIVLSTQPGDGYVTLNWDIQDINVQNVGLFRDTDDNASGRKLISNGLTGTTFTDNSVENDTEYWYWLKVTDVTGTNLNTEAIYALPSTTLSINDNIKDGFKFYPNPTSDKLTIKIPASQFETYTILDISGRVTRMGTIANGVQQLDLNVKKLAKGMYLINLQGAQNKTFKFIKN